MNEETQAEADRRLEARLEETGARDPREVYRGLLRDLRGQNEPAYRELVAAWESDVLAPTAAGSVDPLEAWLEFGLALAQRLAAGRTVEIDETGRARAPKGPPGWDRLLLHLPEGGKGRALPVVIPPEPTPAQRAAVDLLVRGRVKLPDA